MKKVLVLAVVTLLALGLVACGQADEWRPEITDDNGNTRPNILRVGMEATYAPFNFATNTANAYTHPLVGGGMNFVDGYDVQIARRIAADLGVELEIRATAWLGIIPALTSGTIDLIIAGMSRTEERLQTINFTDFYFTSDIVLVVHRDSDFAQLENAQISDFDGARIVAQEGTRYDALISEEMPNATRLTALPDYLALIGAVNSGVADAYVAEYPVALANVRMNPNLTIVRFGADVGFMGGANVAIGVRHNDNYLRTRVNAVLAGISQEERESIMVAASNRIAVPTSAANNANVIALLPNKLGLDI
jgi:ABC-type amino acid transport substrate-binding protein